MATQTSKSQDLVCENREPRRLSNTSRVVYAAALVTAIAVWLIPIRAPLWLDETVTYVQINAGFKNILARQGWPGVPAYQSVLWLFTKLLGTSEVALRVPSVLAMLGAVYLLYRAACELLDPSAGIITAILFCVNPIVIFAAIDARPDAFTVLAVNAAIYLLVRLRNSDSTWLAACFGAMAGVVIWCHFLYAVIVPALLAGFFAVRLGNRKPDSPVNNSAEREGIMLRQLGAAVAGFAIAFLPFVPGTLYILRTRGEHPFDRAPELGDLLRTFAPDWTLPVLALTALAGAIIAIFTRDKRKSSHEGVEGWRILVCQILALVPVLVLFLVSIATPLHIFVVRYRLVGVPGIALCWALIVSGFRPCLLQRFFCVAIVALIAYQYLSSPLARHHGYTWKYALEAAEKNASTDNAPVMICSDLPESDHHALPSGDAAKDSTLYAPLSYYKLTVPVVPLPRALNSEAIRIGTLFLQNAGRRQQRFIALAYIPSYPTLEWITRQVSQTYSAGTIAVFDGVAVIEFSPKSGSIK